MIGIKLNKFISLIIFILLIGYYCYQQLIPNETYTLKDIPKYSNKDYVVINDNNPNFTESSTTSFQKYSELDSLGRAHEAVANLGIDLMPTKKRGYIGMIKTSGFKTVKYDNIEGKYLYNRCHLIGYQLTGQNALETNLITCTRQTNTGTMLEFENKVADYIKETSNHVLYRVTPIYEGNNLIASGIQMEAYSVEDEGKGIKFNIYIYNVQDGIEINYENGDSYQK